MIFVTGASGFLGRELLERLLSNRKSSKICVLFRETPQQSASEKLQNLLQGILGHSLAKQCLSRVEIVPGDLCLENFGLGETAFTALASEVTAIYHCAASTALGQSLDDARKTNVFGTTQIMKLAKLANQQKGSADQQRATQFQLNYLSTAYVAGDTEQIVRPNELRLGQTFKNYYEQSKAEAEFIVRSQWSSIPTCIFRPSVIVGNSITGKTSHFHVFYIPAKFFVKGLFQALPARPNIPFDVVPVDYVADAIVALSNHAFSHGKCYHLCAGVGRETSPLEILELIVETVNTYRKEGLRKLYMPTMIPEMAALAHYSLAAAMAGVKNIEKVVVHHFNLIKQLLPFIPYMIRNPRFDTSDTSRDLTGLLPLPPLFQSYAGGIFRYCLDTNWGKLVPVGDR